MRSLSPSDRRVRPSDRCWLAASTLNLALLASIYAAPLFWASLAAIAGFAVLLAVDAARTRRVRITGASAPMEERAYLGEEAAIPLTVTFAGAVADWTWSAEPDGRWDAAESGGGDEPLRIRWRQLGRQNWPALRVRARSAGGWLAVEWTLDARGAVDVFPPAARIEVDELFASQRAQALANLKRADRWRAPTRDHLHGMREYRPGDRLADVDPKKSARYGRPMARVYARDERQHHWIILDAGRSMIGAIGRSRKIDYYLSAAVALAEEAAARGDRYSFSIVDDAVRDRLVGAASAVPMLRLFREGGLSPRPVPARFDARWAARLARRAPSTVYVLADLLQPSMQRQWVALAPHVPRKHRLCLVHLVEDEHDLDAELARGGPVTAERAGKLAYLEGVERGKRAFAAAIARESAAVAAIRERHWVSGVRRLFRLYRL